MEFICNLVIEDISCKWAFNNLSNNLSNPFNGEVVIAAILNLNIETCYWQQ